MLTRYRPGPDNRVTPSRQSRGQQHHTLTMVQRLGIEMIDARRLVDGVNQRTDQNPDLYV